MCSINYVLGICGHAGAGKDMVADYLVNKHGFIRMALADPIKEIAHDYFGVPWEVLRVSAKPEKVRTLLQQLGTEVGRAYDPDIWVTHLGRELLNHPFEKIVITDVRFPNEAEAIVNKFGGDLILIQRPDNPNKGTSMMQHASETSVEKIPFDLFRTAFINLEGRQEEMFKEITVNVEEWIRCHSSRITPE